MKKFLLTTAGASLLSVSVAWAQVPGADTDYGQAAVDVWVEDDSNDLLELPRQFACIISNTRPDVTGTGNWEALIDEVDCGLESADENYERGGIDYARVIINSSRASDSDPQEVVAFFEGKNMDYIAQVDVTQSPEQFAPYGEWYFAAKLEEEITVSGITANLGNYGGAFVDIGPGATDGTVEIKTGVGFDIPAVAQSLIPSDALPDSVASIIRFSGETLDEAVYLGDTGSNLMAGRTNGTAFYRATLSSDGTSLVSGSGTCLARDNVWENVYRYGLFDATSGDRVSMTGGFGFEFTNSGTTSRGYIGNWGVWLDSQSAIFTPSNRTQDITADGPNGDVARTLDWAPGKLIALDEVDNALLDGDAFSFFDQNNSWTHSVAVWNDTNTNFDVTPDTDYDGQADSGASSTTLAASDLSSGEIVFFYSFEKNAQVIWEGASSVKVFVRDDVSASSDYTDESVTEFRSYDGNNPAAGNFPVSFSGFQSNNGYFSTQAASDTAYFLTGLSAPTGFDPRTLYIDTNGDGSLSTGDDAVRYDFAVGNDNDYVPFDGGSAASFSAGGWPYTEIKLVKVSDFTDVTNCAVGSTDDCPKYEWGFGAYGWDHSVIALEGGDVVTIDRPKRGSISYVTSAMDRNNGKTLGFGADSGAAQEVEKFCSANGSDLSCSMSPDDFDGKTLTVEYDGTSLQGLPGAVANLGDGTAWVSLVNLADGTSFTSGSDSYVVKAVEVGQFLLPPAAGACDDIDFTNLSDLGLSVSDLPDATDRTAFPMPTAAWGDMDETELVCTVTHGDASNCGAAE